MVFHAPPTEQQGQYRYDPTALDSKGPARLFPYAGEDGTLCYILTKLRQNLLDRGQLSQPWSLLLQQIESVLHGLDQGWNQLTTILADLEIFQSGWFNFSLPPNEQFNANFVQKRRDMAEVLLAARKAAKPFTTERPVTSEDGESPIASVDALRSHFYQALESEGRERPIVSDIFKREDGLSDREFARQRLAGQNPTVIRRVQLSDQQLLQAWTGQPYHTTDGTPLDVVQAVNENRLFVADYPLLQHLTAADLQPGRYVGSPTAVFYKGDQGLEPLLIQLEPGRIVSPANEQDDWMRAKLYVQSADVTHHELIAHLCYTHLAMEAFAIATPRQLPASHPVYRLLRPHFQFLLAINTRGNTILLGEGAAIDQLMAPTREASLSLINRAYRDRPFQQYGLLNDIRQRGIEPEVLPEFPYRDDGLLLWEAIERYVTRYLQRYYGDDRAVQQDAYLQAWAAELGTPLNLCPRAEFPQPPAWLPHEWRTQTGLEPEHFPTYPRVPEFPSEDGPSGELTSLQQVIDIATLVIFTCGPQHAAVNFSQFDYVGYVPNAPFALYSRPDRPVPLEQLLPSPEQELDQMELAFALSGIRWGELGSSSLIQFVDGGDRQTLAQFQAELAVIEDKITTRNQQRLVSSGVSYPYLLPSRIPNSINI